MNSEMVFLLLASIGFWLDLILQFVITFKTVAKLPGVSSNSNFNDALLIFFFWRTTFFFTQNKKSGHVIVNSLKFRAQLYLNRTFLLLLCFRLRRYFLADFDEFFLLFRLYLYLQPTLYVDAFSRNPYIAIMPLDANVLLEFLPIFVRLRPLNSE